MDAKPKLGALLGLALRLGVVGFGGGYAVALRVERALVRERRWLDDAAFAEALAVASSLPGTTATNVLTLVGYRLGGVPAALGACVAFLAPSVALMALFGAFYTRIRDLEALGWVLDGMGAATVGVVAAVAVHLRHMAKGGIGLAIAVGGAALLVARALNLLEVVAIAGLVGAIALRSASPPEGGDERHPPRLGGAALLLPGLGVTLPRLAELFLVFARIGVATFGGGVAMIAPMAHEIVTIHGWLGERAFDDAIVLGQITPGPIAISATFIGYRVAGPLGAAVATVGMFGPPFVLSVVAARSLPAFRDNPVVRGVLAGIAPAVVGAIAAASVALFRTAVHGPFGAAAAAASFALLVGFPKLSPLVPIAIAGALSTALRLH